MTDNQDNKAEMKWKVAKTEITKTLYLTNGVISLFDNRPESDYDELQEICDNLNTPSRVSSSGEDREQMIYDLRRFADKSPYLSEISKVGANEIINFLKNQLSPPAEKQPAAILSDMEIAKQAYKIYGKEYGSNLPHPCDVRIHDYILGVNWLRAKLSGK